MVECTDAICCQEVFVGDEDVPLQWAVTVCDTTVDPRVESPKDLTGQTGLSIVFLNPNDGTLSNPVQGSIVGAPTDGIVEYRTTSTTFPSDGLWKGQLDVTLPGEGTKATTIIEIQVSAKLGS